jgi:branched-chain amino acid aminotransferase
MRAMQEAECYVSGEWRPVSEATVHLFDSGLMYGDTVTETLRTFDGKPYEVEAHLKRLRQSLRIARIELDGSLDVAALIGECARRNRPAFAPGELLVKVDVTRGVFEYYREPDVAYPDFNLLLHAIRLPFYKFAALYANGMAVAYPLIRQVPSQSLSNRLKHRSRIHQAIAEREARDFDPDAAALLLDVDGRVAEGTGWNVFVVADGRVRTPSLDNCLAGVSRAVAIGLLRELRVPVDETSVWPDELKTADEVFATATSFCALPITRANGRTVGEGRCGPITNALLAAWSKQIGRDIVEQARELAAAQTASLEASTLDAH